MKDLQRGKQRISIPRDTSEKFSSKALLSAHFFFLSQTEQVWKLEFCTILGVPITHAETTSLFQLDQDFFPAAGKDFLAEIC